MVLRVSWRRQTPQPREPSFRCVPRLPQENRLARSSRCSGAISPSDLFARDHARGSLWFAPLSRAPLSGHRARARRTMTAAARNPPARTQDQRPVRRVLAIPTSHLINAIAPPSIPWPEGRPKPTLPASGGPSNGEPGSCKEHGGAFAAANRSSDGYVCRGSPACARPCASQRAHAGASIASAFFS